MHPFFVNQHILALASLMQLDRAISPPLVQRADGPLNKHSRHRLFTSMLESKCLPCIQKHLQHPTPRSQQASYCSVHHSPVSRY